MTISVLPSHISDQIAAGEVVERPASVVKELIENSLDAQATHIEIKIQDGGKTLIEIRDNGSGMSPEDAEKCVLRHATSKIKNIDDLFSIYSFGFRGEALAAISAVSRFQLITKTKDLNYATQITIQGGESKKIEQTSSNTGTIIRIQDLFYTTPARLQYLKTEETEYRQILKECISFALAHPDVSFKLFKNETLTQDYPATKTLENRLHQIFPKFSRDFIPLEEKNRETHLSGFISSPEAGQSHKNHQYLFVNGRHIYDYRLNFAVREAYVKSCGIEKHLHPFFVLFIQTDPILVDVNVHPRKLEIKFSEPAEIFQLIQSGVIKTLREKSSSFLSDRSSTSSPYAPSKNSFFPPSPPSVKEKKASQNFSQKLFSPFQSFQSLYQEREEKKEIPLSSPEPSTEKKLTALAQIDKKYILAESEEGIFLFDQHALHERERFEKLWEKYKSQPHHLQNLLTPQVFSLTEDEISLLYEHQKALKEMGIDISFPSDTSVEIKTIPAILTGQDLEKILFECLQYLENHHISETGQDQMMRKLLEYKSCRGAIMYGDKISLEEAQKLLDDFLLTKWSHLCPHGRPNHVFWSFEDLDKKFHR